MPRRNLISLDQMLDVIRNEADSVGGVNALCRQVGLDSSTPVYLALQGERSVSDNIALHFGFAKEIMYRRITHGPRTEKA